MIFSKNIYIYILSICSLFSTEDQRGILKGQIINSENQLPLVGANILINNTEIGTISDENGFFTINNIPQNFYKVSISYIGYELKIIPDIWVRPKAYDFLKVILEPMILKFEGVVVEKSYFSRSTINEYQSVSFNNDEIRRAPGSGQEISRILNSLPSVASVGENSQDMMVRGGGPTENGFIIDNIPVPSISHFNTSDGRSNGPIGIINTEMVENLEFYSNGFSSKFGNKLSSYGEIEYREGNNEKLELNLGLGLGGLGGLIEGPLTKNSSYILSYRKSYLNIISDLINAGGLPSYDDFQGKISFKPNIFNTITLLTINGNSIYNRTIQDAVNDGQSEFGTIKNNQNTIGINLKRIWNKKAYSNFSIGYSSQLARNKLYAVENKIGTDSLVFTNKNKMSIKTFRNVNHQKVNNLFNLEYGLEGVFSSTDYNFFRSRTNININKKVSIIDWSTFFSMKNKIFNKILLSSGFRIDYNNYEKNLLISPRLNFDYKLFPKTNLLINFGLYRQNPPEIYLSVEGNKLKSIENSQQSITIEHFFQKSTKVSISFYNKSYKNAPLLGLNEDFNDPTFLMDQLKLYSGIESIGQAKSNGVEFLLQKKRAENIYGLIGGTFFNTTFQDFEGTERNRNYNYKYIFNIVGGYRPNNKWELSLRWSYFGGKPFTSINKVSSSILNEEVLYLDQFNEMKTPDYHSLFIRYERRVNLRKANLITYIEFWNAYNRENIEMYYWSKEFRKINSITYFDFIPVGGFELEF